MGQWTELENNGSGILETLEQKLTNLQNDHYTLESKMIELEMKLANPNESYLKGYLDIIQYKFSKDNA